MDNKTEICIDVTKCNNYTKYKQEGKKYCLVCSRQITTSTKEASEDNMFKHASEDL